MVVPSTRIRSKPAMEQAGFAPLRFSTRFLPDRERLPTWRDVFGRGVVRADVEPLSDVPFRAEARLRALPGHDRLCQHAGAQPPYGGDGG
jgi:hypothetical protein